MNVFDQILSSVEFANRPPVLIDIGASGAINAKWKAISGHSICIAFDADDREMGFVVNESGAYKKLIVFNSLVNDNSGKFPFYLTKSPFCSSMLNPSNQKLNEWSFAELFDVEKIVEMNAVALPQALQESGISYVDWFKTDSQGIDLRLFRSLGEQIIDNIITAEFEPGFADAYDEEDKIWHLLAYMERKPFWMSDIKVCGTQRIGRKTLAKNFAQHGSKLPTGSKLKKSPFWAEMTFLNTFTNSSRTLGKREYLLGWIFAIIEEQYGFAMEIAQRGFNLFSDYVFKELEHRALGIITDVYPLEVALTASFQHIEPMAEMYRLRETALQFINSGQHARSFEILNQIKSQRIPIRSIDLCRAVCFMNMQQPLAAYQSILEELRYFPDNEDAKALLKQIQAVLPVNSTSVNNLEFQHIYQIIKPYTMLDEERLHSLFLLAKEVCEKDIPGNFVECGVASGGSSALLAYVIKTYSSRQRLLYAFDSFEGMPAPSALDTHGGINAEATGWGTGTCAAPENSLLEICMKLGVLHIVKPVKGYYENTVPRIAPFIGEISFMHVDSDWYESTLTIFNNFFSNLSYGALVQIDDYGYWDGCKKAVTDFQIEHKIILNLIKVGSWAVCFQKQ